MQIFTGSKRTPENYEWWLTVLLVTAVVNDSFTHYSSPVYAVYTVHTHTHPFNDFFLGLPRWAGTRKAKPIWILLKQETVSGSGISWAIYKSAFRSRQITMPAPHHSVFLQAGCPSCRPTNSVSTLKESLCSLIDIIYGCDVLVGTWWERMLYICFQQSWQHSWCADRNKYRYFIIVTELLA